MENITDEEFDYAITLSFRGGYGSASNKMTWKDIIDDLRREWMRNDIEGGANQFSWKLYYVVAYMFIKHKTGKTMQQVTCSDIQKFNEDNLLAIIPDPIKFIPNAAKDRDMFGYIAFEYKRYEGRRDVYDGYLHEKTHIKDALFEKIFKYIIDNNIDLTRPKPWEESTK